MRQKFEILGEGEKLVIKEYAELDKEMMSLLCEESYDRTVISEAASNGAAAVAAAIRTKNMYPPGAYAEKLAQAVMAVLETPAGEPAEVFINDLELLSQAKEAEPAGEIENSDADLDDLLDGDSETDEGSLEDEIAVKKIKSSLKVADDEAPDIDDD